MYKHITPTNFLQAPEFHWTTIEKGVILSTFSWGYFFSPIGGLLANKYGGVNIFGFGMLMTGALTIVSPILMKWHLYAYLVGRFTEGLFEVSHLSIGITYPRLDTHETTFCKREYLTRVKD